MTEQEAKRQAWMEKFRNRVGNQIIITNPPVKAEPNVEGEIPIMQRAEYAPIHLFNGS